MILFYAKQRITVAEIIEDPWFQIDYEPTCSIEHEDKLIAEDVHAAFSLYKVRVCQTQTF